MNDSALNTSPSPSNIYGPISARQMFERTFDLLRAHPKLFSGIGLLLFGIELVLRGIVGGSELWIERFVVGAPVLRAMFIVPLGFLAGGLIYIFAQIVKGAVFYATRSNLINNSIKIGEACNLAAAKAWRLVAIAILAALRIFGFALLGYLAAIIPLVIAAVTAGVFTRGIARASVLSLRSGHLAGAAIFLALCFILAIAYCIFIIWIVLRYSVAVPAALEENLHANDSIRRSIQLTRGGKGRLIALYVAIFAFYIAVLCLILPIQLTSLHIAQAHVGVLPPAFHWWAALGSVIVIFAGSVVVVFAGIATTLCYFDLRVRKEGFGLEVVGDTHASARGTLPPILDGPIEDLPVS